MKYTLLYLVAALFLLSNVSFAQATKAGLHNSIANDAKMALIKQMNSKLMSEARKNQCAFMADSDSFLPGCDFKLNHLAATVMDVRRQLAASGISGYKFEVSAHMESTGNPEHSRELTERRASAIANELVGRGVPSNEIFSVGMGFDQPLVTPDNTPAKQAKNRRYELRIRM